MNLPLYPQGKRPWYPLDRRLGRTQSRSGHGGEQENSQPQSAFEPLIIQSVDQGYATELSLLLAILLLRKMEVSVFLLYSKHVFGSGQKY
jgi:hypothetical protein